MRAGVVLFSFALLFFVGCATAPKPMVNEAMTADEMLDRIARSLRFAENFSADGSITINTPKMNQSAGFDITARKTDSVKISVYGPFGITVGSALFTRHEFTAYNALNNTVYRGSPEKKMQSLAMFKDIPFELLVGSLQGIHPFNPSSHIDSFTVNAGGIYSFVVFNVDGSLEKFTYNDDVHRITRCIHKNSGGEIVWSVKYWYKHTEKDSIVPEQVEVSVPSKESTLLLEYGTISSDPFLSPFTISYPEDAEIITIE